MGKKENSTIEQPAETLASSEREPKAAPPQAEKAAAGKQAAQPPLAEGVKKRRTRSGASGATKPRAAAKHTPAKKDETEKPPREEPQKELKQQSPKTARKASPKRKAAQPRQKSAPSASVLPEKTTEKALPAEDMFAVNAAESAVADASEIVDIMHEELLRAPELLDAMEPQTSGTDAELSAGASEDALQEVALPSQEAAQIFAELPAFDIPEMPQEAEILQKPKKTLFARLKEAFAETPALPEKSNVASESPETSAALAPEQQCAEAEAQKAAEDISAFARLQEKKIEELLSAKQRETAVEGQNAPQTSVAARAAEAPEQEPEHENETPFVLSTFKEEEFAARISEQEEAQNAQEGGDAERLAKLSAQAEEAQKAEAEPAVRQLAEKAEVPEAKPPVPSGTETLEKGPQEPTTEASAERAPMLPAAANQEQDNRAFPERTKAARKPWGFWNLFKMRRSEDPPEALAVSAAAPRESTPFESEQQERSGKDTAISALHSEPEEETPVAHTLATGAEQPEQEGTPKEASVAATESVAAAWETPSAEGKASQSAAEPQQAEADQKKRGRRRKKNAKAALSADAASLSSLGVEHSAVSGSNLERELQVPLSEAEQALDDVQSAAREAGSEAAKVEPLAEKQAAALAKEVSEEQEAKEPQPEAKPDGEAQEPGSEEWKRTAQEESEERPAVLEESAEAAASAKQAAAEKEQTALGEENPAENAEGLSASQESSDEAAPEEPDEGLSAPQESSEETVSAEEAALEEPDEEVEYELPPRRHVTAFKVFVSLTAVLTFSAALFVWLLFLFSGTSLVTTKPDVDLPNFQGLTEAQVRADAQYSNFDIEFDTVYSNDVGVGIIVDQTPKPPKQVKENAHIVLRVSVGTHTVQVPDLVGIDRYDAKALLKDSSLNMLVKQEDDEDHSENTVLRTDPAAGTTVDADTTITVYVSRGEAMYTSVVVPDCVGSTQTEASQLLNSRGLSAGSVQQISSAQPAGTVVSQSPSSGTVMTRGSRVDLKISAGDAGQLVGADGHTHVYVTTHVVPTAGSYGFDMRTCTICGYYELYNLVPPTG